MITISGISSFVYKTFFHQFKSNSHLSTLIKGYSHNTIHNINTLYMNYNTDSDVNKKFIVVTGGVISGIGKGITASSIGVLIKMLNLRPTAIKIDPYLNVDAGTMSPFEHGETFVLDDGGETDLDLGNYERFLDLKLTNDSNLTTGKIYQAVINRERKGEYLGKTVQIIPHITNEIIYRILQVSKRPVDDSNIEPDVCVIELGGTIGDIESMPFVEALRQLQLKVKPENFCLVHVSMVPIIGEDGEQKTKPTQHSVKELRGLGLSPDFIVCRAKSPVTQSSRDKIALFCNVPENHVLSIHDVNNTYNVPLLMINQCFEALLSKRLGLDQVALKQQQASNHGIPITFISKQIDNDNDNKKQSISFPWNPQFKSIWDNVVHKVDTANIDVSIALVGKYTVQSDAYLSLISALKHSSIATGQKMKLLMIESSHLEQYTHDTDPEIYYHAWETLRQANGVVIPGGFGSRGVDGMIEAVKYVRENNIPFLGVCLGMQVAVIEYTRNILLRKIANSEEFNSTLLPEDRAIVFMPEGSREIMGGTMRLGSRKTLIQEHSKAWSLYNQSNEIQERHRHRYEVNPKLVHLLEDHGLVFTGKDETGERMEIVELSKQSHPHHPYFIAVQFHPEFKSRPQQPAPVFFGLLDAAKLCKSIQSSSQVSPLNEVEV